MVGGSCFGRAAPRRGRRTSRTIKQIERPPDASPGRKIEKNMRMHDEIRAKRDEIYAIARRHKVERLWGFGLLRRSLGVGGCARRGVST